MLQMEKCESFEERQEPLLNTLPTKQQYLNGYIQSFYSHRLFIESASRLFLAYFTVHIFSLITFHLHIATLLSASTPAQYFMLLPEVLWAVAVVLFKRLLLAQDPHEIGQKRLNLIVQIKPIQLIFIDLLTVTIFLAARNFFLSKNFYLLIVDLILNLLSLRIMLQAYNKEREVSSTLNYMKQQEFYIVPTVDVRLMEEPFQIQSNSSQKNINCNEKAFKSSLKKYFKPARRRQKSAYSEQELECQLYSH